MTTSGAKELWGTRLRGRGRPNGPFAWAIWSVPRRALAVILAVELLAVLVLAVGLVHGVDLRSGALLTLVVLAGIGILGTEFSLGVERIRHQLDHCPHIDLSSVWAFCAAALLPGVLASAVVALIYAHLYIRVWRRAVPLHRVVFSTATVLLAVQAAAGVIGTSATPGQFHTVAGLLAVLFGILTYAAINMGLVVAVIVLSGPSRNVAAFLQVLRHGDEAALEFATLSMGALTAGVMASLGPAYAALVLPPLLVLHRAVLVRQLEEAASTDGKTGVLNAAAWRVRVDREMHRAERTAGPATVLVLDLDHFKHVNDRYGHLVGDRVLAAVASAVRNEVRDEDLVGRFGGEEFVVFLQGVDGDGGRTAKAVAERIRRRVADLAVSVTDPAGAVVVDGLTVSIGGATLAVDGNDLAQLLKVADTAMYAAKHAGRNTVRLGLHLVPRRLGSRPRRRPTPHPRS